MSPEQDNNFVVAHFEHVVYTRQHEQAGRMLLKLLKLLDDNYGNIPPQLIVRGHSNFASREALLDHVFTRLAAAITSLFADPEFQLSDTGFLQALPLQRWLAVIFSYTPMRNADHVIYSLNNLGWDSEVVQWHAKDVFKMALLTLPDSEISLDLDMIWQASPVLAVNLAIVWVSPRFLGTPAAHHRREVVLGWLPDKLAQLNVEQLDSLPKNVWHDLYMHCSYAARPDRHRIKRVVHEVCHKLMDRYGLTDVVLKPLNQLPLKNGKPVMLVLLEWFHSSHSNYRTHSVPLRGLREKFHVIGMGLNTCVDQAGREVFDEFIDMQQGSVLDQVAQVKRVVEENGVGTLFMLAVGMYLTTIFVASLRLAHIQLASIGHGASTQSPWVDYFAVDEDFVGDESTYTEKVIAVPKDAMPFVASAALDKSLIKPVIRDNPEVVKIAIAATTMKINPLFLDALKQIAEKTKTPVVFHFFMGFATDLIAPLAQRMIKTVLGKYAEVYHHMPYNEYMSKMQECDMFITPFPYGNMNGIADAVACGLSGVCKSGPQVHEHIDVGLFQRLELPEWTIAPTVEGYIEAIIRMVDDHKERNTLRKKLLKSNALEKLYNGRPEVLGQQLYEILQKAQTA